MSLKLSSGENTQATWLVHEDFPKDNEGHLMNDMEADAVVSGVAAIGKVRSEKFNSEQNKVMICFDVKTPSGETKEYWFTATASIGSKSTLGKMLRRWRGRDFTEAEASDFTLDKILGKQVRLDLSATQSNSGRVYIKLEAMKASNAKVEPQDELFVYDFDDPSQDNLDRLPKYTQDDINSRRGVQTESTTKVEDNQSDNGAIDTSEIPF